MSERFFAMLLACCITATCFGQIEGPATSAPGDLIVLSAVGEFESSAWVLANSDKTFLLVENNRKVVFASGTPGKYVFVLATSVVVSETAIETRIYQHVVEIIGNVPTPPTPGPNPGPDPPKPVPPDPDLSQLGRDALAAVQQADTKPEEVAAAANNLRTAASKAAGLSTMTVPEINAGLVRLNRQGPFNDSSVTDRWRPFLQWFGSAMSEVQDRESAIESLNEIADGLDASLARQPAKHDADDDTITGAMRAIKQDLGRIREQIGN
jgi:hypothetical protein